MAVAAVQVALELVLLGITEAMVVYLEAAEVAEAETLVVAFPNFLEQVEMVGQAVR
jgi:hypothetical protein